MLIQTPTPKILKLDIAGNPQDWISIEQAVVYYATEMVVYELGNAVTTYRGGYNRISQKQSEITTNSIIAVKGHTKKLDFSSIPKLSNHSLFERDKHLCAYCGQVFHDYDLSREHIKPVKQGGEDIWSNVVTACKVCNNKKGCKTPEQARMPLLYLPYTPDM